MTIIDVHFRLGTPAEREALEALQLRSSIESSPHRESILKNPESIAVAADLLETGRVELADVGGRAVGFSVLLPPMNLISELDGLFVEPIWWRKGIGTMLVRNAFDRAGREGATALDVTANPLAAEFYAKAGFIHTGVAETRFGKAFRMQCTLAAPAEPEKHV